MNRLQLYISKSGVGRTELIDINADENVRRLVGDMRSVVAAIDYKASEKSVFYIVVYVDGGYIVHVIRTIPPTRPVHLDASVYVDKKLDLMAEDLIDVLEQVRETVSAKAVTQEDMDRLRQVFDTEYDLRDKASRVKTMSGGQYAFLSYGGDSGLSLAEVIDSGLYRPEWSEYRAVVVADASVASCPESMIDLSEAYEEGLESDDDVSPGDMNRSGGLRERIKCVLWAIMGFVAGIVVMLIAGLFK